MLSLDEHRELIEEYLAALPFAAELGALAEAMRYSLDGGGKRIRPLLCLACGEATGTQPEELLPAAAAVELVHTFGMVHDDLPALDDDAVRRGRATSHVQFDEATAILNGDALLAQALALALSYPTPAVARELSRATLGMIGGQYDDVRGGSVDLVSLHALKTGRLFDAAVGCALAVGDVPEREQVPWRSFASEFGFLYQIVDDLLDEDGLAAELGPGRTREIAAETEARARARLAEIPADTSLLAELVSGLKSRAPAS
ncbi:MAG TPA: polyprenyl synthetase family protein [Gaiellaceae bacterium]|nr:polyprenyl synthetase family protein [Gaiellaceae bacterium]